MSDEMVDVEIGTGNTILPPKNNKIALIDADTIIFATCTVLEYYEALLPRDFYTEDEWGELVTDPGYSEIDNCIFGINLEEAKLHSDNRIKDILDATGCMDYELHFTSKRESFRYTLVDTKYKSGRTGRTPFGIIELRDLFLKEGKSTIHTKWEADDIVVALKRDNPDKYIMCAVDKDLLYSLPGEHFNYYQSTKYKIPMKWIEVDELTALKHHYMQVLTGDASDSVIGLDGIGPKGAEKILKGLTTKEEMWDAVVNAYKTNKKGVRTEMDAILNMRLVNMHQLVLNDNNEYEVKLWRP